MGRIKYLIEKYLPGIYVYSIEIGNSIEEDVFTLIIHYFYFLKGMEWFF